MVGSLSKGKTAPFCHLPYMCTRMTLIQRFPDKSSYKVYWNPFLLYLFLCVQTLGDYIDNRPRCFVCWFNVSSRTTSSMTHTAVGKVKINPPSSYNQTTKCNLRAISNHNKFVISSSHHIALHMNYLYFLSLKKCVMYWLYSIV